MPLAWRQVLHRLQKASTLLCLKRFNVNSLVQAAGTATTLSSAGGLLKNLEGGLKPEALSSSFAAQKPGWETALSMLK
jgi:hypothetical protein